jgi:hypothetical protein
LNDGFEGWMTAPVEFGSEQDSASHAKKRNLDNSIIYTATTFVLRTTLDPQHDGFMTRNISRIPGKSTDGLSKRASYWNVIQQELDAFEQKERARLSED